MGVQGLLVVQLMKENGDGKIEEMTGRQVQEEKKIEMEKDLEEIGVDADLMSVIVILKGVPQGELGVKIVGDDLQERKGVLLEENEMDQLGVEEMIVALAMIEVLEVEMNVDLEEGTTVVHQIGGLHLENLTEMTKPQGIVTAVMIGVIEALQEEEMTIGGLDQEWLVTEIVEVRAIVV